VTRCSRVKSISFVTFPLLRFTAFTQRLPVPPGTPVRVPARPLTVPECSMLRGHQSPRILSGGYWSRAMLRPN
jgi:hypothetical protein